MDVGKKKKKKRLTVRLYIGTVRYTHTHTDCSQHSVYIVPFLKGTKAIKQLNDKWSQCHV